MQLLGAIEQTWPASCWTSYRVLVAVSGGRDSVALLRALVNIREKVLKSSSATGGIFVAHFNHRLRGDDADCDECFVKELCAELEVPFYVGHPDDPSDAVASDEASLRDQRYDFLERTARELNCRYIATGHHAADQTETILFRILRGTGLRGLAGIPVQRLLDESITIVRPMLECWPEAIEQAMQDWQQTWRTDDSNRESHYSRNFLRNDVLPMIYERFGKQKVDKNILSLGLQAQQCDSFLRSRAAAIIDRAVKVDGAECSVDCSIVAMEDQVVRRELFASLFRDHGWRLDGIGLRELDLLSSMTTKPDDIPSFDLPGGVACRKVGNSIVLTKQSS